MPINSFLYPGAKVTTGFDVANSVRFNSGSSDALTKTLGSGGNRKTFTISLWTKPSSVSQQQMFLSADDNQFGFENSGIVFFYENNGGTEKPYIRWRPQYRDPSAWYHFCLAVDTTQSTNTNRVKFYVNGSQVTDTISATYPDQNQDLTWNTNVAHAIGRYSSSGGHYDGYMAEYVLIDGTALAPTSFGEFDEDSGIWKPIDVSGLTFGDEGFYLDFEDSSALGDDVSGNGNDFTVNNLTAIDQSTDTCTNNFATLNPLMGGRGSTLTEGNLKVSSESDNNYDVATFGSDMKWYYEWKVDENYDGSGGGVRLGAIHIDELSTNDNFSNFATTKVKLYTNSNDGKTQEGAGDNVITSLTRATTNDIIMCACDGTNAKIWWGINGTWLDYGSGTGDPGAGSNAAPWASNAMASGIYFPVICYSGTAAGGQLNLGNPSFTISSGNADADGYGNFEYAVPSGFYALCTKNLSEYG